MGNRLNHGQFNRPEHETQVNIAGQFRMVTSSLAFSMKIMMHPLLGVDFALGTPHIMSHSASPSYPPSPSPRHPSVSSPF